MTYFNGLNTGFALAMLIACYALPTSPTAWALLLGLNATISVGHALRSRK